MIVLNCWCQPPASDIHELVVGLLGSDRINGDILVDEGIRIITKLILMGRILFPMYSK